MDADHRTSNSSRTTSCASRRQRTLGQYFTPEPVVALCYRMLRDLDPHTTNPTIIDPACGEGAFLAYALDHDITTPERLFGVEKDASIARAIPSGRMNLFIGDGLSASPCLPSADWVVGNPPFGTQGTIDVKRVKADFTIWRGDLSRYPIEVLFLERFVQLAKPGGHIAIIVPDGILANAKRSYVREWLWAHTEVKAVVSLPQHTFQRHGAVANASVLVLWKRVDAGKTVDWDTGVLGYTYSDDRALQISIPMLPHSPADRLDPAYYDPDFVENRRFLERRPDTVPLGDLIEFTTYGAVGSREYTDSGVRYLTPANLVLTEEGYFAGVDIHSPERFVPEGSRSDPARSRLRKGDLLLANSGVGCIGRAAVFYSDEPCNISQHINLIRLTPDPPASLKEGRKDITLLPFRALGHGNTPPPLERGGRGRGGVEPEYVAVYLQTRFGRRQIDREKCGVGACGINFDRIRSILLPILPDARRWEIVEAYRRCAIRDAVERLEHMIVLG